MMNPISIVIMLISCRIHPWNNHHEKSLVLNQNYNKMRVYPKIEIYVQYLLGGTMEITFAYGLVIKYMTGQQRIYRFRIK